MSVDPITHQTSEYATRTPCETPPTVFVSDRDADPETFAQKFLKVEIFWFTLEKHPKIQDSSFDLDASSAIIWHHITSGLPFPKTMTFVNRWFTILLKVTTTTRLTATFSSLAHSTSTGSLNSKLNELQIKQSKVFLSHNKTIESTGKGSVK